MSKKSREEAARLFSNLIRGRSQACVNIDVVAVVIDASSVIHGHNNVLIILTHA